MIAGRWARITGGEGEGGAGDTSLVRLTPVRPGYPGRLEGGTAMTSPRTATYREAASAAIDAAADELVTISKDLHAHPELNYQEHHAAAILTASLERHGFDVERGAGGVETAFRGVATGSGDDPSIGILVEYDALPAASGPASPTTRSAMAFACGARNDVRIVSMPRRRALGTKSKPGGRARRTVPARPLDVGAGAALRRHLRLRQGRGRASDVQPGEPIARNTRLGNTCARDPTSGLRLGRSDHSALAQRPPPD